MTLTEIENLSFADLKTRQAELIVAAKAADAGELAARYVQARTDAKQRDEKLAEQAQTIASMNAGNTALQEKVAQRESECRELEQQLAAKDQEIARLGKMNEAIEERLTKDVADGQAKVTKFAAELATEINRANDAETLAKARRIALADVMKTISPVLAAE